MAPAATAGVAAGACPASDGAFASGLTLPVAVSAAAYVLVFFRRGAVVAISDRRSTRVIVCFALTVTTVSSQSRRRASQHEKQSGHDYKSTDYEPPRVRGQAR